MEELKMSNKKSCCKKCKYPLKDKDVVCPNCGATVIIKLGMLKKEDLKNLKES